LHCHVRESKSDLTRSPVAIAFAVLFLSTRIDMAYPVDYRHRLVVALALIGSACGEPPSNSPSAPVSTVAAGFDSTKPAPVGPGANLNPNLFWFDSAGHRSARLITPLDANGASSRTGKIVFLSIGMSNADQEFCGAAPPAVCNPWTFEGRANADPMKSPRLVLVNGAASGQMANTWDSPTAQNYDRVKARLTALGLTEKQVQVIWLKVANGDPTISLPSPNADAYQLERSLGNIVRSLRVRYPSLRQVYMSSRIYAGYANVSVNPEPYAFESGFSVGWLVKAQVLQMSLGMLDPIAGDLRAPAVAPWVSWGPYLWANGTTPRGDGLTWQRGDFESDGTHPSQSGESKVCQLLFNYFRTSPYSSCWYFGRTC
jgi:hypothetical protein